MFLYKKNKNEDMAKSENIVEGEREREREREREIYIYIFKYIDFIETAYILIR